MTDQKPYLLRAIYQWIIDNDQTPQIMITQADKSGISGLPNHLANQEQLILNISPQATPDCVIENDALYFTTRFSGRPYQISVAMEAIAAIFSRESQEGMGFEVKAQQNTQQEIPPEPSADNVKPKKRPNHLKIIK